MREVEIKDEAGKIVRKQIHPILVTATVSTDSMQGTFSEPTADGKSVTRQTFTGVRIPDLPPAPDLSKVKLGKPVDLFNGENLDGWVIIGGPHWAEVKSKRPEGGKVEGWVAVYEGVSNDWSFIGFNSCELALSDVTVAPDEVAWLKKQIEGVGPEKPIALFCHHPLNPKTKAYRVKNAEEILGLCSGRKLRLVASGHWHGNQVETRDGVLFTTTACCTATRDNFDGTAQKGYRLFHLDDETVTTEFIEVGA